MAPKKLLRAEDYTVGWLCAISEELMAARMMLDEEHLVPPKTNLWDENVYECGEINRHNLVIISLALFQPGKVSAQRTIGPIGQSFPNIKVHLLVGIGGGIPRKPSQGDPTKDIHLGDVVVGCGEWPGQLAVIEYDYRRLHPNYREQLGSLDGPLRKIVNSLTPIITDHKWGQSKYKEHLERFEHISEFKHPGLDKDILFPTDQIHESREEHGGICTTCDRSKQVQRLPRQSREPVIHLGTILSGDTVWQDGRSRDDLSQEFPAAICVEMEAAAVMNDLHPLVIRGIADYADSHKNDAWRHYAASTPAAFAREILYKIQPIGADPRDEGIGNDVSESSNSTIKERLADAQALLKPRDGKKSQVIGKAIVTLHQIRAVSMSQQIFDAKTHHIIIWTLMVAEKEMSCWDKLSNQEKIYHIKEALKHSEEFAKAVSGSHDESIKIQLTLEQCILRGRSAALSVNEGADTDEMAKLKKDAVKGIEDALYTLKRRDPDTYERYRELALNWRNRIEHSF